MGPSGSGKSTLLNLLGCLDKPTTGAYFLGDTDVAKLSDDQISHIRNQRIGFIFQSFNLIPSLTVLENIEVPFFYAGVGPRAARQTGARARRRRSGSSTGSTTGRPSSRAASSSASRSRARSRTIRSSSSPTSRRETSTPRPATRSWRSSTS